MSRAVSTVHDPDHASRCAAAMRRACARLTMPTHSSPAGHPSRWREAPLAAGKYDGKRMNIGSIKRLRIAGLHPTRRFSTGFGLLAALLLVFGLIGPSLAWGAEIGSASCRAREWQYV